MTAVTQIALTAPTGPTSSSSARAAEPVYDRIGVGYSSVRRPDPRWARIIRAALGDARTVLNVGAGSGAYEPTDVQVVAVEPSLEMRAQRDRTAAAPCVIGRAESLPFDDQAFDAVQAVLTVHHWSDLEGGVSELLRVASRFAVVTYDMDVQAGFWFTRDYVPEIAEAERSRVPSLERLTSLLGPCEVAELPVWHDFTDGFMTAFWRRPEAYLDPLMRRACSAFALTDAEAVERGVERLRADLASGAWHRRYADMITRDSMDVGFRLLTGTSPQAAGDRRTTAGERAGV
ncbi:class I SAM-dependent methyltransferase [Streptomyces sp. NBC_00503]|uniref:class I SAM-dependent methyltransferase n=1 Tax=Streptomyces sp. NBC_00503 TaxID=2903659 RepID=UPI002E822500|nr:class I SAM-dependent methyltransferase [Streptomyces sp. NBC_00503]WUD79682.1 class I SAM-dependent methyltransferase [Streptomyces sp. NBC_00503]